MSTGPQQATRRINELVSSGVPLTDPRCEELLQYLRSVPPAVATTTPLVLPVHPQFLPHPTGASSRDPSPAFGTAGVFGGEDGSGAAGPQGMPPDDVGGGGSGGGGVVADFWGAIPLAPPTSDALAFLPSVPSHSTGVGTAGVGANYVTPPSYTASGDGYPATSQGYASVGEPANDSAGGASIQGGPAFGLAVPASGGGGSLAEAVGAPFSGGWAQQTQPPAQQVQQAQQAQQRHRQRQQPSAAEYVHPPQSSSALPLGGEFYPDSDARFGIGGGGSEGGDGVGGGATGGDAWTPSYSGGYSASLGVPPGQAALGYEADARVNFSRAPASGRAPQLTVLSYPSHPQQSQQEQQQRQQQHLELQLQRQQRQQRQELEQQQQQLQQAQQQQRLELAPQREHQRLEQEQQHYQEQRQQQQYQQQAEQQKNLQQGDTEQWSQPFASAASQPDRTYQESWRSPSDAPRMPSALAASVHALPQPLQSNPSLMPPTHAPRSATSSEMSRGFEVASPAAAMAVTPRPARPGAVGSGGGGSGTPRSGTPSAARRPPGPSSSSGGSGGDSLPAAATSKPALPPNTATSFGGIHVSEILREGELQTDVSRSALLSRARRLRASRAKAANMKSAAAVVPQVQPDPAAGQPSARAGEPSQDSEEQPGPLGAPAPGAFVEGQAHQPRGASYGQVVPPPPPGPMPPQVQDAAPVAPARDRLGDDARRREHLSSLPPARHAVVNAESELPPSWSHDPQRQLMPAQDSRDGLLSAFSQPQQQQQRMASGLHEEPAVSQGPPASAALRMSEPLRLMQQDQGQQEWRPQQPSSDVSYDQHQGGLYRGQERLQPLAQARTSPPFTQGGSSSHAMTYAHQLPFGNASQGRRAPPPPPRQTAATAVASEQPPEAPLGLPPRPIKTAKSTKAGKQPAGPKAGAQSPETRSSKEGKQLKPSKAKLSKSGKQSKQAKASASQEPVLREAVQPAEAAQPVDKATRSPSSRQQLAAGVPRDPSAGLQPLAPAPPVGLAGGPGAHLQTSLAMSLGTVQGVAPRLSAPLDPFLQVSAATAVHAAAPGMASLGAYQGHPGVLGELGEHDAVVSPAQEQYAVTAPNAATMAAQDGLTPEQRQYQQLFLLQQYELHRRQQQLLLSQQHQQQAAIAQLDASQRQSLMDARCTVPQQAATGGLPAHPIGGGASGASRASSPRDRPLILPVAPPSATTGGHEQQRVRQQQLEMLRQIQRQQALQQHLRQREQHMHVDVGGGALPLPPSPGTPPARLGHSAAAGAPPSPAVLTAAAGRHRRRACRPPQFCRLPSLPPGAAPTPQASSQARSRQPPVLNPHSRCSPTAPGRATRTAWAQP